MKLKVLKKLVLTVAVAAGVMFAGMNVTEASTKVVVQSGDTLSEIAQTYHVKVKKLKKANKIHNIDKIFIGEKFIISKKGNVKLVTPRIKKSQRVVASTTARVASAAAPVRRAVSNYSNNNSTSNSSSNYNGGSLDSIGTIESGNNYVARNGDYVGKYQLSSSMLHGDYSAANQEATARQYAVSRYGSVGNAVAYHNAHKSW